MFKNRNRQNMSDTVAVCVLCTVEKVWEGVAEGCRNHTVMPL